MTVPNTTVRVERERHRRPVRCASRSADLGGVPAGQRRRPLAAGADMASIGELKAGRARRPRYSREGGVTGGRGDRAEGLSGGAESAGGPASATGAGAHGRRRGALLRWQAGWPAGAGRVQPGRITVSDRGGRRAGRTVCPSLVGGRAGTEATTGSLPERLTREEPMPPRWSWPRRGHPPSRPGRGTVVPHLFGSGQNLAARLMLRSAGSSRRPSERDGPACRQQGGHGHRRGAARSRTNCHRTAGRGRPDGAVTRNHRRHAAVDLPAHDAWRGACQPGQVEALAPEAWRRAGISARLRTPTADGFLETSRQRARHGQPGREGSGASGSPTARSAATPGRAGAMYRGTPTSGPPEAPTCGRVRPAGRGRVAGLGSEGWRRPYGTRSGADAAGPSPASR